MTGGGAVGVAASAAAAGGAAAARAATRERDRDSRDWPEKKLSVLAHEVAKLRTEEGLDKKKICVHFFNNPKGCSRGAKCRFSHEIP